MNRVSYRRTLQYADGAANTAFAKPTYTGSQSCILSLIMVAEDEAVKTAARRMILRDSAAFAILLCGTALLFAVTLFLFRSFTAHRSELARYWSRAGQDDLRANQPDDAVSAFRAALLYAPADRSYELELAQALSQAHCAGCSDESYNYYLNLWDSQPGNGSINLALARLARKRKEIQTAINFYRASIYGTWEGNGVDRRASVRLELAEYLIETGALSSARLELLTAGTNAPEGFDRDKEIATLLRKTGDPADALAYYQKAIADQPNDAETLDEAGRLAYASGEYEQARQILAKALQNKISTAQASQIEVLMHNAQRILELAAPATLPAHERVSRILADRSIAKSRLDSCQIEANETPAGMASMQDLTQRWSAPAAAASAANLLQNPELQDSALLLIFDTEIEMARICSPAAGDDALLLTLATLSHSTATAERTAQIVSPTD